MSHCSICLQVPIKNLRPSTTYKVWVTGATKSLFYNEKFYMGQVSDVAEVTLPGMIFYFVYFTADSLIINIFNFWKGY